MKLWRLYLTLLFAISLAACGSKSDGGDSWQETRDWFQGHFDPPSKEDSVEAMPMPTELEDPAVYHYPSLAMDASEEGIARIFDRNVNGQMVEVPLLLVGDGTLTSSDFVTSTSSVPRANEVDLRFAYKPTDERFAEVSLFANATRVLNWYKDLGFDTEQEIAEINVHAMIGGSPNNAFYMPSIGGNLSKFSIGDGDGVRLQNLATEADVIAHEIGHHVIFRHIKRMQGDSIVLHDGLADFFTMIRNDDPCFAPTICPVGSDVCDANKQCFRTADNSLKWTDPSLGTVPPMIRGQVLSGMLWDIKETGAISNNQLAVLVFNSLDFLGDGSSIADFVEALYESDRRTFQGQFQQLIESAASDRELI